MSEEMLDMTDTVIPKTDQLNADCLVAGPRTITITGVDKVDGEQPILIHYEGEEGRPYKPCLGMRRVFISAWGKNAMKYIGRKVTVFNNPEVKWAGKEQGGIQISHMSHIKAPFKFMLTVSRGKKSPFSVGVIETTPLKAATDSELKYFQTEMEGADTMKALQDVGKLMTKEKFDKDSKAKLTVFHKAASERIREAQTPQD